MKNTFLVLAILFLGFINVNAQDEGFSKGDLFVTGSFRIASANEGDNKNSVFDVSPSLAYFLSENIALGGRLTYLNRKSKSQGITTNENTSFGVGTFGRYYLTPQNKFSIFGELSIDYLRNSNNSSDDSVNTLNFGLGAGLNYFVSKRFSIEASLAFLNYGISNSNADDTDSRSVIDFGTDFTNVGLGINYKF